MSSAQYSPKEDPLEKFTVPVHAEPPTHTIPNHPVQPTARLINFPVSPLSSSYPNHFALVIDNCFTETECQKLIELAVSSTTPPGQWEAAEVNIGGGKQRLMTDIRNTGRIIRDDFEAADFIFQRVKPWLHEVAVLGGAECKWRTATDTNGLRWQMTRVNERLRFLKYGQGQFFKRHRDGIFSTKQVRPDEPEECSYLTIQIYLSSSADLIGGATAFSGQWGHGNEADLELPVKPIPGRVLIFQHRYLLHNGALVERGEKITVRSDIMYKCIDIMEVE